MTGEVIKSFLVGLGFSVDDSSLAKFNQALNSATVKIAALYGSIKLTSAAIVYGISKISEGFEQMGYEYHIIAPAINKALVLRRELLKAYSLAGINITKVIQSSVRLNMSLAKTKFAFEAIYKSVASRFFGLLTKQSELLREKLYQNMPKILNVLERFVKGVFKAFEATVILGTRLWSILERVYDFFVKLDKATDGWSTIILGVVAAWKLLNLSFLASPFGVVLAGLVGILALYDDFKTFQEGGKSLFDWTSFLPVIAAVTSALNAMLSVWKSLVDVVGNLILAFYQLFHSDTRGFFDSLAASGKAVLDVFKNLYEYLKTIWGTGGVLSSIGNFAGGLFGGAGGQNVAANLQNNPVNRPVANPLGTSQNNQTNQNVTQQTQINVTGTADAGSVGKAVAGEQNRVNFDMTRNLRGASR